MQNTLREARARRRITQRDLAIKASASLSERMTENRCWRIENGYHEPSPEERAALAGALDTTEAELFPELAAVASTEGEAQA